MDYSEILSSLMENLDLTLKSVSQAVSYDSSYISKWINGKNLPASSQVNDINKTLAYYFAKHAGEKCPNQNLCFFKWGSGPI